MKKKTQISFCRLFPGSNEKGLALIFSLVLLVLISVMGFYGINTSTVEGWRSSNYLASRQAYYAARAGVEDGISRVLSGAVTDQGSELVLTWNVGTTYNSANFNNSFTITHRLIGNPLTVALANGKPQLLISSTGTSGNASKTLQAIYTAKMSVSLLTNAVRACSKISFSNGVFLDSYDSRLGSYSTQAVNTDPLGYTFANGNAPMTTTKDGGTVSLDTNSVVHGNVTATSTGNNGTITTNNGAVIYGTSTQNAAPSNCDPVGVDALVLKHKPSGSVSDLNLSATSRTVDASSSPINVHKFNLTNNSTYTITGTGNVAMYVDDQIMIDSTSQLVISPGVNLTIYIKNSINLNGQGIVNNNADPQSLILYMGGGTANIYQSSPFYGIVYAPGAKIQTDSTHGSGDFYGAVIANEVNLKNPQKFHYDEALASFHGTEMDTSVILGYNFSNLVGK